MPLKTGLFTSHARVCAALKVIDMTSNGVKKFCHQILMTPARPAFKKHNILYGSKNLTRRTSYENEKQKTENGLRLKYGGEATHACLKSQVLNIYKGNLNWIKIRTGRHLCVQKFRRDPMIWERLVWIKKVKGDAQCLVKKARRRTLCSCPCSVFQRERQRWRRWRRWWSKSAKVEPLKSLWRTGQARRDRHAEWVASKFLRVDDTAQVNKSIDEYMTCNQFHPTQCESLDPSPESPPNMHKKKLSQVWTISRPNKERWRFSSLFSSDPQPQRKLDPPSST